MKEEDFNDIKKVIEKIKPFIAIAVLILIIFSSYNLYHYVNLQKEIKTSCGYQAGEKVYCVCDKNFVSQIYTPDNPYYEASESLESKLKMPEGS